MSHSEKSRILKYKCKKNVYINQKHKISLIINKRATDKDISEDYIKQKYTDKQGWY